MSTQHTPGPLEREQIPTHKPYMVREKFHFNGKYRGVSFELQKWQFGIESSLLGRPDVNWCFYLLLTADQFDAETWKQLWLEPEGVAVKGRVSYDYYGSSLVCAIEFHGGVTFYEKVAGIDGERQTVKIGCDYAHHMDEAWNESLTSVLMDMERAVDSLYEACPSIKVWCNGNGKFFPADKGEFDTSGEFYSNEYKEKRELENAFEKAKAEGRA